MYEMPGDVAKAFTYRRKASCPRPPSTLSTLQQPVKAKAATPNKTIHTHGQEKNANRVHIHDRLKVYRKDKGHLPLLCNCQILKWTAAYPTEKGNHCSQT